MGIPRRSKSSKGGNKGKKKVNCPSASDARKTKSMDGLIGAGRLEVQCYNSSDEEGSLS